MTFSASTQALRKFWASAPAGVTVYECLTLTHSKFSQTWNLCATASFDGTTEAGAAVSFVHVPFSVRLPVSDAGGGALLNVTIANVGRDMVSEIEAANTRPSERIELVFRVYLSDDLTKPQARPIRLSLDSINMTAEALTGQAGGSDYLNKRFPGGSARYIPELFPGLLR